MAKFTVDVKEVWCHTVEVELPTDATKEEILAAVNEKIAEGRRRQHRIRLHSRSRELERP